jgi:hypothetical protein
MRYNALGWRFRWLAEIQKKGGGTHVFIIQVRRSCGGVVVGRLGGV